MSDRVTTYSMLVSVVGVVTAAVGWATDLDVLYWIGMVLALPAFIVFGVLAVLLVGCLAFAAASLVVVLPMSLVKECRTHLTRRRT